MGEKRDVVAEIEEIRNRTGPPNWDNGITKLFVLCRQAGDLEQDDERNGYFLVASIAAIETYFRWEIQRLIDSEDPRYIGNLQLEDSQFRITHDLLIAVHGKRISIGELAAHSVRLNNLEAINRIMSKLLQTDFLALVRDVRSPELRREKGVAAPTFLRSASETMTRVQRTFELRHIICHEAHLESRMEADGVRELCSACYEFAVASHYGITYHRNPNAPLTLVEAYDAAIQRVQALEAQIKTSEELIRPKLGPMSRAAFEKMQHAWKSYVECEADFCGSHSPNGNRGVLDAKLAIERLYKERLHALNEYAQNVA